VVRDDAAALACGAVETKKYKIVELPNVAAYRSAEPNG